ncbi:hypothetical protein P691DRAFT_813166 [Macrolepiota fuliginosa MF-IS2]|uniref:polynucleotide adenylyltransferase n=1 Tax=Macrolepiota fuliginosa MF-IS2 TaxID=1400762 RepID=A0A9P5XE70_9AGAR|nr:hypothetical protein P691DRAFT_813166 [Macrolepiota fuliginosa MF-IS2]
MDLSPPQRRHASKQRFAQDLSQSLFDFVIQLLPPADELHIKEDVRKLLERLIRTIEPDSRLLAFGSTANGFSLRNSDMDLCCLIDSGERLSASDLVTMLGDLLERETKFHVKPLPHARIPIVKLSLDPSPGLPFGIACDIGFENRLAIENTRLLYSYAKIDPTRVRTLVLFLKIWSKRRKINSPYTGTLSSYGYVLLVIYFLVHVKNPPVLPNLQQMPPLRPTNKDESTLNGYNVWFFDDIDILCQRWQSDNTETVAELLIDFFRYFSRDFSYNTGVASIRAGLLKKDIKGWQNDLSGGRYNDARERNRLCIEDPFETDYNVARCVTKDGLYTIRGEFMRASRILATRPDRAVIALAELCEERKDEDLISAPPHGSGPPRLSSIPPQTPYTQSLRPRGVVRERLSPPEGFYAPVRITSPGSGSRPPLANSNPDSPQLNVTDTDATATSSTSPTPVPGSPPASAPEHHTFSHDSQILRRLQPASLSPSAALPQLSVPKHPIWASPPLPPEVSSSADQALYDTELDQSLILGMAAAREDDPGAGADNVGRGRRGYPVNGVGVGVGDGESVSGSEVFTDVDEYEEESEIGSVKGVVEGYQHNPGLAGSGPGVGSAGAGTGGMRRPSWHYHHSQTNFMQPTASGSLKSPIGLSVPVNGFGARGRFTRHQHQHQHQHQHTSPEHPHTPTQADASPSPPASFRTPPLSIPIPTSNSNIGSNANSAASSPRSEYRGDNMYARRSVSGPPPRYHSHHHHQQHGHNHGHNFNLNFNFNHHPNHNQYYAQQMQMRGQGWPGLGGVGIAHQLNSPLVMNAVGAGGAIGGGGGGDSEQVGLGVGETSTVYYQTTAPRSPRVTLPASASVSASGTVSGAQSPQSQNASGVASASTSTPGGGVSPLTPYQNYLTPGSGAGGSAAASPQLQAQLRELQERQERLNMQLAMQMRLQMDSAAGAGAGGSGGVLGSGTTGVDVNVNVLGRELRDLRGLRLRSVGEVEEGQGGDTPTPGIGLSGRRGYGKLNGSGGEKERSRSRSSVRLGSPAVGAEPTSVSVPALIPTPVEEVEVLYTASARPDSRERAQSGRGPRGKVKAKAKQNGNGNARVKATSSPTPSGNEVEIAHGTGTTPAPAPTLAPEPGNGDKEVGLGMKDGDAGSSAASTASTDSAALSSSSKDLTSVSEASSVKDSSEPSAVSVTAMAATVAGAPLETKEGVQGKDSGPRRREKTKAKTKQAKQQQQQQPQQSQQQADSRARTKGKGKEKSKENGKPNENGNGNGKGKEKEKPDKQKQERGLPVPAPLVSVRITKEEEERFHARGGVDPNADGAGAGADRGGEVNEGPS